jgi:hypothetical protein
MNSDGAICFLRRSRRLSSIRHPAIIGTMNMSTPITVAIMMRGSRPIVLPKYEHAKSIITRATYDTKPTGDMFGPTDADACEAVTAVGSLFSAIEEDEGIAFSRLLASVEAIYPFPVAGTDVYVSRALPRRVFYGSSNFCEGCDYVLKSARSSTRQIV